jgi:signal transduction histidine kinase
LREVARVAREIGDGNLDARPCLSHHHAAGEVRTLALSIDDMATRIRKQLEDQRVLLAAVSHELRTPLGHLRILAELARDPKADIPKILDDIEAEVKEIDELVGQLLAQARLDFSGVEKKAFDAGDAAERTARASSSRSRIAAPASRRASRSSSSSPPAPASTATWDWDWRWSAASPRPTAARPTPRTSPPAPKSASRFNRPRFF